MPRGNNKNRYHNKKKRKNAGRNQAHTSTAPPVVDDLVETPTGDWPQNASHNDDAWENGDASRNESGTLIKDEECLTKVRCPSDDFQSKTDDASCKAAVDVNESVQHPSPAQTPKSLQSGGSDLNIEVTGSDDHPEDDATSIRREERTWTSWICCCGVFDLFRAMIK